MEENELTPNRFPDLTFAEHRETTAKDLEAIAEEFTKLAAVVREGNMKAVEDMFLGDEDKREDDSKIVKLREIFVLRYFHRQERVKKP
jgi:hypothetical protein